MKKCQVCHVKTAGFICSCPCKLYLCGKECMTQSHSVYYEKTNTKTGVLFTNRLQLMSVKLGARELIPMETHPDTTQVFFVEKVSPNYVGTVRDFPREGLGMPKLEVYRLYKIWKKTDPLPAEFILRKEGENHGRRAEDLLPPEQDPYSWWEKKFLYFRAVQYQGPNQCRW